MRWRAVLGRPGRHLRHVVSEYGEYVEHSTAPVTRREIPGPATVLIIELDEPLHAAGAAEGGALRPVDAFVGSPGRGPAITWHGGVQHCVEVRLTLLGAYRLFGTMRELAGRIVPLDGLWQGPANRLAERLVAADGAEARFDILDQVLGAALATGPAPDPEVTHAWDRLQHAAGEIAIGDLLAETGWSRSRLAERFRAQTGLTPKAAASMLRFNRAAELLVVQENTSIASVALSCGYYDQAHLNRDFRRLAGCTPTEWKRAQLTTLVGAGHVPEG